MRQLKIQRSITDRQGESLDKYLFDIAHIPMITPDEEETLASDIKAGGRKGQRAKEKLVKANLRFVVSVAKQYQHKGLSLIDLIDEGNIGLIKAADKFDATRGFKFISYAVWWIRQSILQALADQGRMVRLPLNQVGALSKINGEIAKFEQANQRKPTAEELSEITDIDRDRLEKTLKADIRHTSIDAPFQEGEDGNLSDVLPSDDNSVNQAVDRESMLTDLGDIFNRVLKPREQDIVRRSYGIGCSEEGAEEIARHFGLTRERVRQIREKSIDKIRHSGYASILAKYLG